MADSKLSALPATTTPAGADLTYLDQGGVSKGATLANLGKALDSTVIPNTPAGNIASTNVQAAINELDTEKAALAGATFTGAVKTTGAEGTQFQLALGGQEWDVNMVTAGAFYVNDKTNSKSPFVVSPNSPNSVTIGTSTVAVVGTLALGTNDLTMTGSLGATGARVTKGWFTDLQVTNAIAGSVTGNAGTATNLDGGNNTTLLGSVPYQSDTNTTSLLSPNTTTTQKWLSQTGTGTNGAAPSWQTAPAQGILTYYFTNTASDISTYYAQTVAPYTPKTTDTFATLAGGLTTLRNWATPTGIPNLGFIPAGQFEFHIHASKSAGTKTAQIYCEFWEVSALGADIGKIGTSETSVALTGSEAEYRLYFSTANVYNMTSTASRVVARVIANVSGGGSAPTVLLYVGDEADSHISLPSVTVDATNFVPYTGATADLALGTHNLTLTGSLAATGARVTKGWFADIESTNMPTVGGTALSSTFSPIAGSASITTVGTIGAGIWNAGAVTSSGAVQGTTGVFTAASSLTLGTASSHTGAIILNNAGGNFTTTIQSGTAVASRVYTLPTDFGAAGTVLTDAAGNGTLSWGAAGGVSWGTSISGTTTGGLALTLSNGADASAIALSVTAGNTQANTPGPLAQFDTGTAAKGIIGVNIKCVNAASGAYGLQIDPSTTNTGAGINFANSGGAGWKAINMSVNSSGGTSYGLYQGTIGVASQTSTGIFQHLGIGSGSTTYGLYQDQISGNSGNTVAVGWYVANMAASAGSDVVGKFFSLNGSNTGTFTARTTDTAEILYTRNHTGATSVTDNYNVLNISRTNIVNNAGGTLLSQGSLIQLSGVDTQTAGTATPTYDLLKLNPSTLSTGSSIHLTVANSTVAPTNGHIYAVLGNTQSAAHTLMKLDLGTAAQAHTGLLVNMFGASSTQYGIKIDPSTTGTGTGIFFNTNGVNAAARTCIDFNDINFGIANGNFYGLKINYVNNGSGGGSGTAKGYGIYINVIGRYGTGYGIYQERICDDSSSSGAQNASAGVYQNVINNNGGSGAIAYGLYQGTLSNAASGVAYGWYVSNIGSATTGNSGKYFSLNNAQSSATLQARTNDASEILFSRTNTATSATVADNFNLSYWKDTAVMNGAGGTLTVAGAVHKCETVSTQTAGTLTHTKDVYNATQSATITTGKLFTGVVGATERFKVHPMVANSGTNNAYLFDTTTAISGTTTLAIFANSGTAKVTIDNAGNYLSTGSLTTAAPSGGTAGAWKHGILVTDTVAADTTRYIQLDVGGTLYKVIISSI